MKQLKLIIAASILLSPLAANADLIQLVTVDTDGDLITDTFFGTLIFPNESQNPFGPDATCSLGGGGGLPLCQIGEFLPDRESFDPFNDLGDTGISIGDSLPLFGAWIFDDDWNVASIFGWTTFDLGGDNGVLTLVFGRVGNICGTIQDAGPTLPCFGLDDSETFAYQLQSVTSVPEPGMLGLLGLGLAVFGLRRRRA